VQAVRGTSARIYDTRKTTPGLRALEKYAVRMGGGCNHRMGLYDQVLIKDNHIAAMPDTSAEGFKRFIADLRRRYRSVVIEIEADSLDLIRRVLVAHPDILLLDNMSVAQLRAALAVIGAATKRSGKRIYTEASGGITLAKVRTIARLGVDRISVGALTHSAPGIDVAMEIDPQ